MNSLLTEYGLPSGQRLQLVRGDITAETTDAIVNAANMFLQHGAGVAGAIVRRGGPVIQQESDAWVQKHGPVSHAEPAWTSGGNLACRIVIHAVGPVWGGDAAADQADADLTAAVSGCLRLADKLGMASIAFPAISTGIFGFPKERAAGLIFTSILTYLESPSKINTIKIVLFDPATITAFEKAWHDHIDSKYKA